MSARTEAQQDISIVHSMYHQKRAKEGHDISTRVLRRYAIFLVKYPYVVFLIILLIVVLSAVLGFVDAAGAQPLPDFSEPIKGFEARGTAISKRKTAFENLVKAEGSKVLQSFTYSRKRRSSFQLDVGLDLSQYVDKMFLVYEHVNEANLVYHMMSICQLHEKRIKNFSSFQFYFNRYRTHHLPNYIAYMNGKVDCQSISSSEIDKFFKHLSLCVSYYSNGLYEACSLDSSRCTAINDTCRTHGNATNSQNAAYIFYNVFHYLTDREFAQNPSWLRFTASVDILSAYDTVQENLFKPLYDKMLKNLKNTEFQDVQIVAYEMYDFKFYIFQIEMVLQSLFIVTAVVLVVLFVWFYTKSFFLGLMTIVCILSALIISYLVYGRVFDLEFFPFLNILTLIFIVGIGADDAFVYTGFWKEAKRLYVIKNAANFNEYMIKWTTHSLRHAVLSMLVTSLTTACAFYANISSSVTSVKCFGLYAGTAIIVNFILMITLFPAAVIFHEMHLTKCMHFCCPKTCSPSSASMLDDGESLEIGQISAMDSTDTSVKETIFDKCKKFLNLVSSKIFKEYLPYMILKFKFIWIVIFLTIGIGAAAVTFSTPGMKPPSTKDFQMFASSSSLEQFDMKYKQKFAFASFGGTFNLQAHVVFGVEDTDNGNKFNPDEKGTIKFNAGSLDIANNQIWLLKFCQNLERALFYETSAVCYNVQRLFVSLQGPCLYGQTLCCRKTLPLPNEEFMFCLKEALKFFPQVSIYGPLFDQDGKLKTFAIDVNTNYRSSHDFDYNKNLYNTLNKYFDEQLANVSTSDFNGWWYVEQEFYDLQRSLFDGTKLSLGIAIAVSFVVILCTTWNLLLSLFSIITITFIISVTVGVLIFNGWRLNILESIVFSVAAGLSADFTLHYTVAYKSSVIKDTRAERVKSALTRIGPAILMGAITTFIAGVVMVPSTILAYVQMSHFLMLIMFVSWLYSTFFLLPLCAVIGPTGTKCQLTFSKITGVRNTFSKHKQHMEMEPGPCKTNFGGVYEGPTGNDVKL